MRRHGFGYPNRYLPGMVVLAALASTLCFAVASAFQQHAASKAPRELSLRLGLLGNLARRPMWWIGMAGDAGGYGFQWLALRLGSLTLVQPLLLADLLFSLPLGGMLARRRPHTGELLAAGAVVAGLTAALTAAAPTAHGADLSGARAIALGASMAAVVGALATAARGRSPTTRAALLGSAAGAAGAMLAVMTRVVTVALDGGYIELFRTWKPYALAASAIASLLLVQSAFQAGPLRASLPGINVVDPIASVVIGLVVMGEHIQLGFGRVVLEITGVVVALTGALVLTGFESVMVALGAAPPPAAEATS